MIHINELFDILPINCGDKNINILTFNDMEWYIDNCKKDYYEKFLDFKFSSDIQDYDLRGYIYNTILSCKLRISSIYEARLLLKDKENTTVYGGCTIFEDKNTKNIEIAYFVLPEYQNKGLGTMILKAVCNALVKSDIPFDNIIITVRYNNIASLRVAEKAKFKCIKEVEGRYGKNIIMCLDNNM